MFDGVFFEFPKIGFVFFFFVACEAMCPVRLPGIYFPHLRAFASVTVRPSKLLWFLKWMAIILLIAALMSPVKEEIYRPETAASHETFLVLDASESMRAKGFDSAAPQRSRFDAVRDIVADFVAARKGDAVGLVVFGSRAFVASPPTLSHDLITGILRQLSVGAAGPYTALYEAIARAAVLAERGKGERVAVVLSDGRVTSDGRFDAPTALALAKKARLRLYTVAVGSDERDTELLRRMAEASGGRFFKADDAAALRQAYETIDTLEKSPAVVRPVTIKHYYYIYPLFAGFLTLLLYVFLRNRSAL